MIVTDLNGKVTTWLDTALLSGSIEANLNAPWQITAAVRSNDLSVDRIFADDGDPLVAQSNRLVYVFIRDNDPDCIGGCEECAWCCRASGILMSPEDQGDPDSATTHFVAYDPWQYLFGRPCFADDSGTAIGPLGKLFTAAEFPGGGAQIAATLLQWTVASEGVGVFIDPGPTYGGTSDWTGTIEDTPAFDFTVQQGMTLGDAWNQLVSTGDNPASSFPDNGCDIVLEPIYDPGTSGSPRRPGYLSQLSIYNLAGSDKPIAPMGWGRLNRSATTADRQHDGTPGNFINVANFHVGQGGVAVPVGGPVPANDPSVTKYQPYWQTQFFPDQNSKDTVLALANQALVLGKQGKRTFTVDVDPIRSQALPFRDYTIGDRIPILAPGGTATPHFGRPSLRVVAAGYQRVQTIPVQILPDGVTSVQQLLTSPDWRGDDT